jgi:general L-amino acid transport system ATP-binding protein
MTDIDIASIAPIITAHNLEKWQGSVQVLKGVDLQVYSQEVVALIGPTNAGKSTLLRTLNGLEPHDRGRILVNGIELTQSPKRLAAVRHEVGMVFQQCSLFPHLTVLQNLTLAPIWVQRLPKLDAIESALQVLERVDCLEQAQQYPSQLSNGQQQLVAIARALALEPKIMLLDDLTSSLDLEQSEKVFDMIRSLAESGMTMLIVTHAVEWIEAVAHRVLFMDEGQIVEETTPKEFFQNPTEERSRKFLAQILSP